MNNQTALVNGIKWTCENPDTGQKWTATLGPATLAALHYTGHDGAPDIWIVRIALRGEEDELCGPVIRTVGEAMVAAEPWARETLRRWRDLGALAGEALSAMGEP